MTTEAQPSPDRPSPDHPAPEIPADVLMAVLGEQVSTLHELASDLEASLSETLSASDKLSTEAFRTIQRVDYMRQSLKDIGAILTHVGQDLRWTDGHEIRLDALHEIVDMRESLGSLHEVRVGPQHVHDIWL